MQNTSHAVMAQPTCVRARRPALDRSSVLMALRLSRVQPAHGSPKVALENRRGCASPRCAALANYFAEVHSVDVFDGRLSIPRPFGILGTELDAHFDWPVFEAVEEVNRYFQSRLFGILSGGG